MSDNIIQRENFIQDFVDVTVEVLVTMASLEARATNIAEIDGNCGQLDVTSCMDITGVLGFSGGRRGSILITLSTATATRIIGGMLGERCRTINADVRDGIGELLNMIAGGAKTRLQQKGVSFELSLPNTVIGANHQIAAPASTSRTHIDFKTEAGDFFIEVYLKKQ